MTAAPSLSGGGFFSRPAWSGPAACCNSDSGGGRDPTRGNSPSPHCIPAAGESPPTCYANTHRLCFPLERLEEAVYMFPAVRRAFTFTVGSFRLFCFERCSCVNKCTERPQGLWSTFWVVQYIKTPYNKMFSIQLLLYISSQTIALYVHPVTHK